MSQSVMANLENRIENSLSETAKLAIILCAPAVQFGGTWGFIHAGDDAYRQKLDIMRAERGCATGIQLHNGILVSVKPDFIVSNVNKLLPGAIDKNFTQKIDSRRQSEIERFNQFTNKVVNEGKYIIDKGMYYEIILGVYSYNNSHKMRVNGKDYPAFNLTLNEILPLAHKLSRKEDAVYIRAVRPDGTKVYDKLFNLYGNSNGQLAIYKAMSIAQSGHGLFIHFRIKK